MPTDQVVDRLLEAFKNQPTAAPDSRPTESGEVPVRAVYEGTLVEGVFDPATERLTITTGPLAGKRFKSPSGAAIAVVRELKPSVHPNRNGWTFWTVAGTGDLLQSRRGSRGA